MKESFYRYNPWWEEPYLLAGVFDRPRVIELMKKHLSGRGVIFLTGLRRVGKTTLFKIFIKYLLEKEGIKPRHIFYISLDDYLLSKKNIIEIIEEYRQIMKISFSEKVYLFLDEIGYQNNFELQLKNLYDSQNVKIFASSSSTSILKSKKSYLTGRHLIIEVRPLDFEEYLLFKSIKISHKDDHLRQPYFEEFLEIGGLPEYVLKNDIEYLKELVDDIIYKDIAAFYSIKNPQLLKDFFVLLMERSGKVISINKIARILSISPDTAKRYLQMFRDTYLIYLVPRYGRPNERLIAPKKIYAADLGIRNFFTGFKEKGALFENYIYLKIRHKNPSYLYQDGLELDFMTADKTLIEVKYQSEMTDKQKEFFQKVKAQKKIVVRGLDDLEKLE